MNLIEASILARQLMQQHGLEKWSFKFDHARRRFGKCDYTHHQITLSKPLTFLNSIDEVRDTLLHEIAHALAPEIITGRGGAPSAGKSALAPCDVTRMKKSSAHPANLHRFYSAVPNANGGWNAGERPVANINAKSAAVS